MKLMKFCPCLQNFSELWNLFPWVSMGNNCFGCYFQKLYIFSFLKLYILKDSGTRFLSVDNWNCSISLSDFILNSLLVVGGSCFFFQMYYAGRNSFSPVYSLSFNRTSLFVALASGVRMLDFTVWMWSTEGVSVLE